MIITANIATTWRKSRSGSSLLYNMWLNWLGGTGYQSHTSMSVIPGSKVPFLQKPSYCMLPSWPLVMLVCLHWTKQTGILPPPVWDVLHCWPPVPPCRLSFTQTSILLSDYYRCQLKGRFKKRAILCLYLLYKTARWNKYAIFLPWTGSVKWAWLCFKFSGQTQIMVKKCLSNIFVISIHNSVCEKGEIPKQ